MPAPLGPGMAELEARISRDYVINGRRSAARVGYAFRWLRVGFPNGFPLSDAADASAEYAAVRMRDGAAAATAANELRLLQRALRLMGHQVRLTIPHTNNARQGFLERDQLERVCARLRPAVVAIVRFAYLTGWRKREVFGLKWADVDFGAGVLRLDADRSKNGRARSYPFAQHPGLSALLRARRTVACGPYVFHHHGKPYRDIWHQFKRACAACGLQGMTVHDMRRSCVRNMERAGVPRRVAMALTGHRTESVYARYDIVNEGDLGEGVRRVASYQCGNQMLVNVLDDS
jgi:integrase